MLGIGARKTTVFLPHIYVIRDALHIKRDCRIETFRNVIRKRSWNLRTTVIIIRSDTSNYLQIVKS